MRYFKESRSLCSVAAQAPQARRWRNGLLPVLADLVHSHFCCGVEWFRVADRQIRRCLGHCALAAVAAGQGSARAGAARAARDHVQDKFGHALSTDQKRICRAQGRDRAISAAQTNRYSGTEAGAVAARLRDSRLRVSRGANAAAARQAEPANGTDGNRFIADANGDGSNEKIAGDHFNADEEIIGRRRRGRDQHELTVAVRKRSVNRISPTVITAS